MSAIELKLPEFMTSLDLVEVQVNIDFVSLCIVGVVLVVAV